MAITFPTTSELLSDLILVGYKALIFVAILIVGWIIGRAVGFLIGKVVSKAGGDALLRQTVIGRALMKSDYTSFKLSQTITKWIIYIVAFLAALETLSLPILTNYVSSFIIYLPRIVGAILILIIGIIVSDWMGELVKKSSSPEKRELFYLNAVGDVIKVVLYFVTITLSLSYLGVDVTILYIIAQAFAWAVAIFVGVVAGIVVGWTLKDRVKEWLEQYSNK
jgi:putative Mn2+ efflux pump MntP